MHNVAAKHPDRIKQLSEVYKKWTGRVGIAKR